jgi:D-amino-acid dehydrogenase
MEKHVVVVGGGVIGLSCAFYLLKEGHKVTLVDKDDPTANLNCSMGNAGMIVPSHFIPLAAPGVIGQGIKWMMDSSSPFYIKPRFNADLFRWLIKFWKASTQAHVDRTAKSIYEANQYSLDLYKALSEKEGIQLNYEQKGLLMLCQTEKGLEEEIEVAKRAEILGIRTKVYHGDELKELEPNIQIQAVGAVHYIDDANIHPVLFVQELIQKLQSNPSFKLVAKQEIDDFICFGKQLKGVSFKNGLELLGDEVVIATGSYSQALAKKLKVQIPIQSGKGYSMTVPTQNEALRTPTILCEARVAVTPFGDTIRFGGTMELGGVAYTINPKRLKGIINAAQAYFPKFDTQELTKVEPWSGLRPCPPDGIPYIGKIRKYDNLWMATGHGMMGLSLAPATGKFIADLITNKPTAVNLSIFDPNRFTV